MVTLNLEERNQLITENMALAVHFAKWFRASRMSKDDIIQEAYLGLMDAAERYDPNLGRFSTYARFHIMKSIMEAIHNRNEIVRTPRRKPSTMCDSIDRNSEVRTIAENLPDEGPPVYEAIDQRDKEAAIRECIKKLPAREGIVIRLRHGVNTPQLTLSKVGDILGVTPERVRQIQRGAEEKLRALLLECAILLDEGAVWPGA